MKNHSVSLLTHCLFLVMIAVSPSITFAQDSSHIQHFGYYWGMSGLGQVTTYVTTMFISNQFNSSDINQLADLDIADLIKLNNLGLKGIVDVSRIFFDPNNDYRPYPDYENRWNIYWAKIYSHLSQVLAFYPMDEPEGNLYSMEDYATAVHLIKINIDTLAKPIPILMVVTPDGVLRIEDGSLFVPPEISWLGFDEYGCWDSGCYRGVSIPNKFQIVVTNAKQHPGRKVIVIPDSVAFGQTVPSAAVQQQKVQLINNYYQLCKNEPLCVGMSPFLWQSMPNVQGGLIGADSMPIVEERLKQIGLEIKPSPTPTPLPGDLNGDTHVNDIDYQLFTSNFGNTTCGNVADIDGNCTVNIFDYNVLVGNWGK